MKRFLSFLLSATIMLSMCAIPTFANDAVKEDDHVVYLTSQSSVSMQDVVSMTDGVVARATEKVSSSEIYDAPFVVVEFEALQNDANLLDYTKDLISIGKIVLIRADAYQANASIITKMLGFPDAGDRLFETAQAALQERITTFGFIVFIDSNLQLQVVRQRIDRATFEQSNTMRSKLSEAKSISAEVQPVEGSITDETLDQEMIERYLNCEKPSLSEQVEAINDFLSYNSPTDVSNYVDMDTELAAQGFDVGCNYEKIYDTVTYYNKQGAVAGSITKRICAARLYPETTVKTGAPKPAATSGTTTKWAFQAVINMSPKWKASDKYHSSTNSTLYTSFTTYPVGSGNTSYKNVIMDYLPKIDTSGATDVTYSLGATGSISSKNGNAAGINGGVSWKQSYKDVEFTIDYSAGANVKTNKAAWNYDMDSAWRIWPTEVEKTTIELKSAVRVDNTGNKKACVQLNVQPCWYQRNGILKTSDYWVIPAMSSVVYQLPVR